MLAWVMNLGFAASEAGADEDVFRFRTNNFNRRRYGGLWWPVIVFFWWLTR